MGCPCDVVAEWLLMGVVFPIIFLPIAVLDCISFVARTTSVSRCLGWSFMFSFCPLSIIREVKCEFFTAVRRDLGMKTLSLSSDEMSCDVRRVCASSEVMSLGLSVLECGVDG